VSAVATESEQKRNAGRPRCQAARESILSATVRLLRDTSVRELAIESIAREAGVGKATIYRWWPNKTEIVIDAFFSEAVPLTEFPNFASPSEAIQGQCARLVEVLSGPLGRVVAQVIGEGQSNREVLTKFRKKFPEHRRAEFALLFAQGVSAGEFNASIDVEVATALVYGPVWYRLLVDPQPLNADFAARLPRLAVAALAA